jgi:hypothetical protein
MDWLSSKIIIVFYINCSLTLNVCITHNLPSFAILHSHKSSVFAWNLEIEASRTYSRATISSRLLLVLFIKRELSLSLATGSHPRRFSSSRIAFLAAS